MTLLHTPEITQLLETEHGERKQAIQRCAPFLLRNRPERFTFYRTVASTVSTELLECLPRALVVVHTPDTYCSLVHFFEKKSWWVGSCVARYVAPLLASGNSTVEQYKELVLKTLHVNEIWAGEVAEHLPRVFRVSDCASLYIDIVLCMNDMWQGIEVTGYLPDMLEKLPPEKHESYLRKVLALARRNPLAAVKASRLHQPETVETTHERTTTSAYDRLTQWEGDPKGHFDIHVFNDAGIIRARHFTNERAIVAHTIEGKNAFEVYSTIHRLKLVSSLQHASWVGYELGRAEQALRDGYWFEQDKPLEERWR